jgi:glucose-6-phosphate isomerase
MDALTRVPDATRNPAAALAATWHHLTDGAGTKAMVVLPYKDRLLLFSRYLQQLVMESLGKELDLQGRRVNQGLTVYGNKGSTDQHAYVQQLRDGLDNFFAVFIEVLADRQGPSPEVEPGVTSGAYLQAFFLGTREALAGNGRASITLTIKQVDARSVGMLIALFERAVGLYASLLGINAYHQPGVEAGKKAAAETLKPSPPGNGGLFPRFVRKMGLSGRRNWCSKFSFTSRPTPDPSKGRTTRTRHTPFSVINNPFPTP